MKLVLTTIEDQKIVQSEICNVSSAVLTSINAMRKLLCTHAERQWGGSEGNNYAICNHPERYRLVPLYARERKTGNTLTIESL